MQNQIFTIYVEKKPNFNLESQGMLRDFTVNLKLNNLKNVKVINRYDIKGINSHECELVKDFILSEVNVDNLYEKINIENKNSFRVEYLPGQYDQRADSAMQCIQILTQKEDLKVKTSKIIILEGLLSENDVEKVKKYYINTVDSREVPVDEMAKFNEENLEIKPVEIIEGFINLEEEQLESFIKEKSLAMTLQDLKLVQNYFKNEERRNPTITEIKVIETYWSDHCRHTTFQTVLTDIEIENGKFSKPIKEALEIYNNYRNELYKDKDKAVTLMDIAVIGMKKLKAIGKLDDLDVSEEINACSIIIDADIEGKNEKYLVMFKNETHNHPTEIEPFGGASTCLGGAIRDPLSGRSYVYQAMRITGCKNPKDDLKNTLKGKLPQRKITKEAAKGYSSYGNQIGLATGYVQELYHDGYEAKRMEVGAVIAAAPYENVIRANPQPTDKIILLGGRTGRDGVGGAAGSSKEHNEKSLESCNAEVQKGNAPTERKIQRLFRNKKVTTMIKRCNDFGAGGVSVAIGELAPGLKINLDLVPKKYEGLNGTEIAISESQERMAVVVSEKDMKKFIKYAENENLEAVAVAEVTEEKRIVMNFNGQEILNISRDFLDTNGAKSFNKVKAIAPKESENYFEKNIFTKNTFEETIKGLVGNLNICSQKGLIENFDSSIGGNTVIMPFGGKYQQTPNEAMVCKIPILNGETSTGTIMSHGFNPYISSWSPFHGAFYAVIESLAKIVAIGGDYKKVRLSLQEYFEKLGCDKEKWGKPFSALLGALYAQHSFQIPAIGGKDSMSGTFKDLNVPPTLISFAVSTVDVNKVVTQEFKKFNSKVISINAKKNEQEIVDTDKLKLNFEKIHSLIDKELVLASYTSKFGGILEAVIKMALGNKIGFKFSEGLNLNEITKLNYGTIILEISDNVNLEKELENIDYTILGETTKEYNIQWNNEIVNLDEIESIYNMPLEEIFPTDYTNKSIYNKKIENYKVKNKLEIKSPLIKVAKPKVVIPVFPGTNCEYDCERAFIKAGAEVEQVVFKNLTSKDIEESIEILAKKIKTSQIVMLPGGFSAGDEPDGSGKFIATVFRNSKIKNEVMELLKNRDGLMLGICNGFQALIKLGLVTYGEITDLNENSETLTNNSIGRHISCMVNTKIVSNSSPWLCKTKVGDVYTIPVSHGEGRFYGSEEGIKSLFENDQVATQYVDLNGNPTYDIKFNPNGSLYAIEGITSPDGRVFGKMGHSERVGANVIKNVIGNHEQKIFESGVHYFK
ncbi:phosphoribosylformylglycinamidine synthase [Clostridium sp. CTA-19]